MSIVFNINKMKSDGIEKKSKKESKTKKDESKERKS